MHYFEDNKNCNILPLLFWDVLVAVITGKLIAKASYFFKKGNESHKKQLMDKINELEVLHKQNSSKNFYKNCLSLGNPIKC